MFKHPENVCMTYMEHAYFSLSISMRLFKGSVLAFVHALCPDIFVTSTSDLLFELEEDMKNVGCR